MTKGRWVPCTPEWVRRWNVCGSTVRRPILVPRDLGLNIFDTPSFDAVGHEHLMTVGPNDDGVPLEHESGEPA